MFVPIIRNSVTYLKMASWKLLIQLINKKTHVIIRFLNVFTYMILQYKTRRVGVVNQINNKVKLCVLYLVFWLSWF